MPKEQSLFREVRTTARIIFLSAIVAACEGGPPAPAPPPEKSPFPTPSATETIIFIGSATPTPEPTMQISPIPTPTLALTPEPILQLTPTPQSTAPPTRTEAPPAPQSTCQYKDVLTPLTIYNDWSLVLVDTIYDVPKSYYPPDLVSVSEAGLNSGSVRSIIIPELKDMVTAAKEAGNPLAVQSAFRSYATQVSTFNYWVSVAGYQAALLASARPGHSEHQLGTAIDFRGVNDSAPWNYSDWGKTKTGTWMAANAWKYGFIMSYPASRSPSKTCYEYEPWHYRYLGLEEAAAVHSSGLSTREWLMQHRGAKFFRESVLNIF